MFATSCSGQKQGDKETEVLIETTEGDIRVKLYNDTPGHRDNFLNNIREGKYDGTMFHRVVRNFMIQAGDPDTRPGEVKDTTKEVERIPAEISFPAHFSRRGVLAAARDEDEKNPVLHRHGKDHNRRRPQRLRELAQGEGGGKTVREEG